MTVGWLRKVLDKMGNEDAQVMICVSKVYFPLCGKCDKLLLIYATKDEPTVNKGEECLVLNPCECENVEEDKNKGDNLLLN